jgi:hypothetical protein
MVSPNSDEEGLLPTIPTIAALRDVMRQPRTNHPGHSSHKITLPRKDFLSRI